MNEALESFLGAVNQLNDMICKATKVVKKTFSFPTHFHTGRMNFIVPERRGKIFPDGTGIFTGN